MACTSPLLLAFFCSHACKLQSHYLLFKLMGILLNLQVVIAIRITKQTNKSQLELDLELDLECETVVRFLQLFASSEFSLNEIKSTPTIHMIHMPHGPNVVLLPKRRY
jgi:hypothetical protein